MKRSYYYGEREKVAKLHILQVFLDRNRIANVQSGLK